MKKLLICSIIILYEGRKVELELFSFFGVDGMINKEIKFYSLLEFYPKRYKIRAVYDVLKKEDKKIYKMYVYSLCFEKEYVKDLIWEFLNKWEESENKLDEEYNRRRLKADEIYNRYEAGQLEQDNIKK